MEVYMENGNHPLLEKLLVAIPIIKSAFAMDSNITLADKDCVCLNSFPGEKFDMGIRKGDKVNPPLRTAITENRKLMVKIPEHLYNLSLTAVVIPIHDENNNVIGGLGIALEGKYEKILKEFHENVENALSTFDTNVDEINKGANSLVSISNSLVESQKNSEHQLKEINKVIGTINQIAKNVHLLGINARIEASRAGEAGKGFAIVANEIQKLSSNIFEFTSIIDNSLNEIQKGVESTSSSINSVVEVGDSQLKGIVEINKSLRDAIEMSKTYLAEIQK